jgi:NADH dehydrogenase FAD-containing subunit
LASRQRLVVLGTGWGGARLARDIDTSKYDITIISPRNHMVFTPLLGECQSNKALLQY